MKLKIEGEPVFKDMIIGFTGGVAGSLFASISIEASIMFGCLGAFLMLIAKVKIVK